VYEAGPLQTANGRFDRMAFAPLEFAFVRGLIAGFALAAPVGPVAVLCIRRALSTGRFQAFVAGLGAAFADMIFGAVAGLGIGVVMTFILDHEIAIGSVGGLIVLAIGVATFRAPVSFSESSGAPSIMSRDFATTFSMAITNPATMIAAIGLFAAFAPIDLYTAPASATLLVTGVFAGSALWWLILVGAVGTFRDAFMRRGLPHLNHISGAIIMLSGLGVLIAVALKILRQSP